MLGQNTRLSKQSNWWSDTTENAGKIPDNLSQWMFDKGSLTSALMDLSNGEFKVNLLWQGIAFAYPHEQQKMAIETTQKSLIREVELTIFDQPVVFARSIIPVSLTGSDEGGLQNLGTKPLGHLLFKDGNIRVTKREFSKTPDQGHDIYARRTPYDYEGQQILVCEFFLPNFTDFL